MHYINIFDKKKNTATISSWIFLNFKKIHSIKTNIQLCINNLNYTDVM